MVLKDQEENWPEVEYSCLKIAAEHRGIGEIYNLV